MSEFVLLLPNTDSLQHGEVYVRVCTSSTKYWPPPTRWRLCQSLYYFYQILAASNKLTIMSGLYYFYQILTASNKVKSMSGLYYFYQILTASNKVKIMSGLYYFYQILTASNKVKIMSEFVLLLPNTDRLQHGEDYVRVCTTSTKYWPPPTWWSICQRLHMTIAKCENYLPVYIPDRV